MVDWEKTRQESRKKKPPKKVPKKKKIAPTTWQSQMRGKNWGKTKKRQRYKEKWWAFRMRGGGKGGEQGSRKNSRKKIKKGGARTAERLREKAKAHAARLLVGRAARVA